jgi:CRISPR-associated endoribonuclease Cas6
MNRIRLSLPRGQWATYQHQDLVHDAIVSALIAAGATAEQVIGAGAEPWTFAALGYHRAHEGQVHGLVISTPSPALAPHLAAIDPSAVRYARAATGELLDFSAASLSTAPPPVCEDPGVLGVLTLSPIAISEPGTKKKRWLTRLDQVDLSAAANARLSRIAGRPVALSVQPDSLYLRANPRHSVLVSTKRMRNGRSAFVIGMQAPLVLAGSRKDLLLAWYAGLGEKTRNGFGCLGLAEEGVGR